MHKYHFKISVDDVEDVSSKGNHLTSVKKKKKHLHFNSAIRKKHIVDLKSRYCETDAAVIFLRLSQVIITLGSGRKWLSAEGVFRAARKVLSIVKRKCNLLLKAIGEEEENISQKKKKYMFTSGSPRVRVLFHYLAVSQRQFIPWDLDLV